MSVETVPMTQEGFDRISKELEQLKTKERPKIIQEIAEARSHGDLKENAEYHAAREKQGMIEARIALLEDRVARAEVFKPTGEQCTMVKFGVYVTIQDEDSGDKKRYQIVGELESDLSAGRISLNSPIAKALMGRKLDDSVEIQVPKGLREFLITAISET